MCSNRHLDRSRCYPWTKYPMIPKYPVIERINTICTNCLARQLGHSNLPHIIQICSGITHGRVLNGELYAQRLKDVDLSAFVYRLFHEDSLHSSGPDKWREIFRKQSVDKWQIRYFCNLALFNQAHDLNINIRFDSSHKYLNWESIVPCLWCWRTAWDISVLL